MNLDLEKLIALQQIDLKIKRLKTELTTVPAECERIQARFNEFSATYNEQIQTLAATQKERRRLSQELEDTQAHLEKYKKDLMKVRNDKEYTTCLREIDVAKKSIGQLETDILKLMDEIEQMEAEVAKSTPEIEAHRQLLAKELAECDRQLAQGEQEIEAVVAERTKLITSMPKSLATRYDRLANARNGNGQAVAEVIEGACSACQMKIRLQSYSEIRRGDEVIVCEYCSRILYYIPPQTEAAAK